MSLAAAVRLERHAAGAPVGGMLSSMVRVTPCGVTRSLRPCAINRYGLAQKTRLATRENLWLSIDGGFYRSATIRTVRT